MPYHGLEIIDFHAHFPYSWGDMRGERSEPVKRFAAKNNARMRLEWDFPEPEPSADSPEERDAYADRWAQEVDNYGLERVVFLTGGGNETLAEVTRRHPDKFLGMVHHDPAGENVLEKLKQGVEEFGFIGYKMLGPRVSIPFEDPSLAPVWEYMQENQLVALVHFGILGGPGGVAHHPRINPLSIYEVARRYPELTIVIPHFGCGYVRELLQLMWACPNVYVDTSGSNRWMDWMPYPLTLKDLYAKYYQQLGAERIIFGTDSSWFPRGFSYRYLQDHVRACSQLNMSQDDMQKIFAGNARAIIKAAQGGSR